MSVEGELRVAILVRHDAVAAVDIHSTRPHFADRVLAGKTPGEATAMVPRLYSICGRSQGIAAALACEAALGERLSGAVIATRERAVESEMVQEYLWRMLVDWPQAVDAPPVPAMLADARNALSSAPDGIPAAVRDIVGRELLGVPIPDWEAMADIDALDLWLPSTATPAARLLHAVRQEDPAFGRSDVALLPAMHSPGTAPALVEALMADAAFDRTPHLHGQPAETGALARMAALPLVGALTAAFGHSLLVRLLARLAELVRLVAGHRDAAPLLGQIPLGPGKGLGWVETARGLLMHAVELTGDRVRRYRIVAPTEWNFHPRGALARGLRGAAAPSDSDLRRRAGLLVQSLDPCVAWRLDVRHA